MVFWRGKDGHLWFTMRAGGRSGTGPRDLGGSVG